MGEQRDDEVPKRLARVESNESSMMVAKIKEGDEVLQRVIVQPGAIRRRMPVMELHVIFKLFRPPTISNSNEDAHSLGRNVKPVV